MGPVGRRGKYLLFDLDGSRLLVVHLGMTGMLRIRTGAGGEDPYVRAWWAFDDGRSLEYRDVRRFGRIAVVPVDDHSALPGLDRLGPEPFDPGFDGDALWRALRGSRRRVKTQLLSQRPVAGVGNIYADEALWLAGIHPGRRTVTRAQAHRLHGAIVEVMAAAIDRGGTTLRDYRRPGARRGRTSTPCAATGGPACRACGAATRWWPARTTPARRRSAGPASTDGGAHRPAVAVPTATCVLGGGRCA